MQPRGTLNFGLTTAAAQPTDVPEQETNPWRFRVAQINNQLNKIKRREEEVQNMWHEVYMKGLRNADNIEMNQGSEYSDCSSHAGVF